MIEVPRCTRMLRSTRVGEKLEQFLSTSGQARQPSTRPFIFVIHAVSNSLDKKWDFTTLTLDGYSDTVEPGHTTKGHKILVLQVLLC
jgi:hypothetical protein